MWHLDFFVCISYAVVVFCCHKPNDNHKTPSLSVFPSKQTVSGCGCRAEEGRSGASLGRERETDLAVVLCTSPGPEVLLAVGTVEWAHSQTSVCTLLLELLAGGSTQPAQQPPPSPTLHSVEN